MHSLLPVVQASFGHSPHPLHIHMLLDLLLKIDWGIKTSGVHHDRSPSPVSPSLPLELKVAHLAPLLLLENHLHGAVVAKACSLCPHIPIQAARSRCQGPVTPLEQGFEPRFPEPQGPGSPHSWPVHGVSEEGSLRGRPQEAEPTLSPLPTPLHWSSENLQNFKLANECGATLAASFCCRECQLCLWPLGVQLPV